MYLKTQLTAIFVLFTMVSVRAGGESHLTRRLITIPVEVNNVTEQFLIDTGSDCTVIDSAFARRLGLEASGVASLERNYSTGDANTTIAEHLGVGSRRWSNVRLVVQDLSPLSRMRPPLVSGVLGTDLLATMMVKLSYSSGTAQVVANIGKDASRLTLRKVASRYLAPVKIGSSTLEMLLDSGTNMTALSGSAWRTLPSSWEANGQIAGVLSSGSPPGSLIGCVPALRLPVTEKQQMVLHNFPIRVITPPQSGSFADTAFAGILGGDILERFEVILDLQHASIYLKPDPEFHPDPYEFVTIGIQFFKEGADAFSVAAVWKKTPAETAGLIVGDRILSVNGHSSTVLELETFADQLHGVAGMPVTMEVERGPRKFIVRMNTQQLVCGSKH